MDAQNCRKKIMQEKKKDVQLQAMWFAAGTAALMACLQRAILVSFLEQWRMFVFLALNLLLLAILFTSTYNPITPTSSNEGDQEIISNTSSSSSSSSSSVELEVEGKNTRKQSGLSSMSTDPEDHREDEGSIDRSKLVKRSSSKKEKVIVHVFENIEDQYGKNDEAQELSKEELNKRAEAFIAMFRQHLLSDAKVGKSCRLHPYSHPKGGEIMPKRRAPYSGRHHYGEKHF